MFDAIEVEINMMSSKRGRYKVEAKETRKSKEEPHASTFVDPKFNYLMKVMEKPVDKLSINNKPAARDNEPQIRNSNYKVPRQPGPPQLQIAQRGQKIPNDNAND